MNKPNPVMRSSYIVNSYPLQLERAGAFIKGFLARPDTIGVYPALLVIHGGLGFRGNITHAVELLAKHGFVSLAIDWYSREGSPDINDEQSVMTAMRTTPDKRVIEDMQAACVYLKAQDFIKGDKIAVIGFCIGGSYALMMACNENIKAAVSFYGLPVYNQLTENKPTSPIEFIPKLCAPLLAIFAGDDDFVSQSQVELLKDSLEAHKKNYELKLYPSQRHAFCDDTLPGHYDPAAAQDAWSSAIDFLNRFLLE